MSYSATNANNTDVHEIHNTVVNATRLNELSSAQRYIDEVGVNAIHEEAMNEEKATISTLQQWPNMPEWKRSYELYTTKRLEEIIQYNYSNVVDYVDREVLLTGKSVYEMPITIDYTCGGVRSVPVHAKKPKLYFDRTLDGMGFSDL